MTRGALTRRLMLWTAFVAFCTLGMAYLPLADTKIPVIGRITYFQAMIVAAGVLGTGTLLRFAGDPEPSGTRTLCRILIAYLAVEVLLVVPVALWIGTASLNTIVGAVFVRFCWLLLPVVLAVCADGRARAIAGTVVVVAAACLALWGLYLAATGGGGFYLDGGEMRFRILYGGATLLFAWPFAVALSGATRRRYVIPLLAVSLVGLTLTNHRSGLIAFAIAGLACLVMSGRLRRLLPWLVPTALIVLVAALVWGEQFGSVFSYTLSRLLDVSSGNGADRLMRWRLAWELFVDRPFNDYVWSWRYYLINLAQPYQPHNFALEIAVTEGVVGLAFYGSVLWVALRDAWHWGRSDAESRALIGFLVAYLLFSFANANWYLPVSIPLLVGAVGALVARVDVLRKTSAASVADEVAR